MIDIAIIAGIKNFKMVRALLHLISHLTEYVLIMLKISININAQINPVLVK